MRKIFVILLLICGSCFVGAQELSLPSEPSDDCGFSLGVKGTLRMIRPIRASTNAVISKSSLMARY